MPEPDAEVVWPMFINEVGVGLTTNMGDAGVVLAVVHNISIGQGVEVMVEWAHSYAADPGISLAGG